MQLLRLVGADDVLATDPLAHRADGRARARRDAACADAALGAEALRTGCANRLDVAFEAAGDDDAVATALDAATPGRALVLVGIPTATARRFTASVARRKGLTLLLCRRMEATDLPRAIALAETGRVELAPLVSERYALAEWRQAFDALTERRGLKVVVEPQRATETT